MTSLPNWMHSSSVAELQGVLARIHLNSSSRISKKGLRRPQKEVEKADGVMSRLQILEETCHQLWGQ